MRLGQKTCKICTLDEEDRTIVDRMLLTGKPFDECVGSLAKKQLFFSKKALSTHFTKHLAISDRARDLLLDMQIEQTKNTTEAAEKVLASVDQLDYIYALVREILVAQKTKLLDESDKRSPEVKLFVDSIENARKLIQTKHELTNGQPDKVQEALRDGTPAAARAIMQQIFGANFVASKDDPSN